MSIDEVLTKVQFSEAHTPVMVREILENFAPLQGRKPVRYFDGTFGRGGHFRAVSAMFGDDLEAVVMDQDRDAIHEAEANFKTLVESGKLRVLHGNFSEFSQHPLEPFDIMLLDLGVSSPQLD